MFLFVVGYFAVVAGGGSAAPMRAPSPEIWPFAEALPLSLGEGLALAAAALALVDAAWRPARTGLDAALSISCAGVAVGALWVAPELLSSSYAALLALAVGDALAALGRPGAGRRAGDAR